MVRFFKSTNNEITISKPVVHMQTPSCHLTNPSTITTASLQGLDVMRGLLLAFTLECAHPHVCPCLLLPYVIPTKIKSSVILLLYI